MNSKLKKTLIVLAMKIYKKGKVIYGSADRLPGSYMHFLRDLETI